MQHVSLLAVLVLELALSAAAASVPSCSCANYVLDCSNHNVTSLPRTTACADATTVNLKGNLLEAFPDGLNSFEVVLAANNKIKRLPSASQLNHDIKKLELTDNEIAESSHEFRTLSGLRNLRLDKNRLTSLNFLPLQCNLYSLDVSENAISTLSGLGNCAELQFLGLTDNQITTLSTDEFTGMKKLKRLFLFNNRITSIPDGTFSGLQALTDLFLQMNRNLILSSGSFQGLSKLRNLDLGYNNLQSLPIGVFSHTPLLVELDLIVNKLTQLNPNVFTGLHSLQELHLWKNELTAVPTLANCCNDLKELNLSGNNITAPSEEELRAILRGGIQTDIGRLLRPEALRWAVRTYDVSAFVEGQCRCGGLRRNNASVHFCVDTECGTGSAKTDWVAVVRAIA